MIDDTNDKKITLPVWTMAIPLIGVLAYFLSGADAGIYLKLFLAFVLFASIMFQGCSVQQKVHRQLNKAFKNSEIANT